jgi:hypothetical protein
LPLGRVDPRWWVGIGVILVTADYVIGPDPMFPVLYCIPVFIAAWYSGTTTSLLLASVLPLVHVGLLVSVWGQDNLVTIAATLARGLIVGLGAMWLARFAEHERALEHHVETLEGLLPICSFCKSIRNDKGEWEKLELYISDRSDALFSHGFCPSCQKIHYPDSEFQ